MAVTGETMSEEIGRYFRAVRRRENTASVMAGLDGIEAKKNVRPSAAKPEVGHFWSASL